jgi:toxin-antitoxin system PIN domain toxin
VIAVDTNILLYAHRVESPWHERALEALSSLSGSEWAIPWPSLHEFLAIATHPRIFEPPTPLKDALTALETWRSSKLKLLAETDEHWTTLSALLKAGKIAGPQVHDARIAALCLQHAVEELWSADRDFSRYPSLRVRNPLITA